MSQYPPPPPSAPFPPEPSGPVGQPAPGQGYYDARMTAAPAPFAVAHVPPPARQRGTGVALTGAILLITWMILAGCLAVLYLAIIAIAWTQAPAGASLDPVRNSIVWAVAVFAFAVIGSVLAGLFAKRIGRGEGLPTLIATTVAGIMLIVSSVLLVRAFLIIGAHFDPTSSGFISWIVFTVVIWLIPFLFAWGGGLWVFTDPVRKRARAQAEPQGR